MSGDGDVSGWSVPVVSSARLVELVGPADLLVVAPGATVEWVRPDVAAVTRGRESMVFDLASPVYRHGSARWFAEQLRAAVGRPPGTVVEQRAVEVATVARTLRFVAFLLQDEFGGCDPAVVEPTGWAKHWREAADRLESHGLDDGGCCLVCQEVVCDEGCPMAGLRS